MPDADPRWTAGPYTGAGQAPDTGSLAVDGDRPRISRAAAVAMGIGSAALVAALLYAGRGKLPTIGANGPAKPNPRSDPSD